MNPTWRVAALLALLSALLTASAAPASARPPRRPAATVVLHRRTITPAPGVYRYQPPPCTIPAPVTADGYAAMFAKVDGAVWGAGDTALSVALPGRSVWLYSDTASGPDPQHWTKFVHSSAIVQTAGCLHVSASGGQVLPNETDGRFYWIDSAAVIDASHLRVLGYELDATGTATGRYRNAQVTVSAAGDLTFQSWLGYAGAPAVQSLTKDYGLMGNSVSLTATGQVVIPAVFPAPTAEYSYSPQAHPELALASGRTLMSLAVGWASGTPTWQDLRPIYREVTLP